LTALDHRLNAYRADLADIRLKGKVRAKNFVAGKPSRVITHFADMLEEPRPGASLLRQAIFGETVAVFETGSEYAWIQRDWDGYVGYVRADSLGEIGKTPTHRVCVPRTFLYPEADLKYPRCGYLSMASLISVIGQTETRGTKYAELSNGSFIIAKHLCAVDEFEDDFVSVAGRLIHTPYLWGGNTGFGLDCAGLVQLSMMMAGQVVAADSDLQALSTGLIVDRPSGQFDNLQRGDLVFWKGHVGIMETETMLLHSSGHTMNVAREPLQSAIRRIAYLYEMPTIVRRLLV